MSLSIDDLFEAGVPNAIAGAALRATQQAMADEDGRVKIEPETIEQDLARLVLVVMELLRQLMEHQALARMDRDTLTEQEIDTLSDALFRARNRIHELREVFGIPVEAFNVDLGPLGKVL
ncbi:MAG: gas vesicle protein K [Pseudomonadota bacterium]